MRILGVDPGTQVVGCGIIDSDNLDTAMVYYGTIKPPAKFDMANRLNFIFNELSAVVSKYKPDAVAIEQPFMAKNAKSALAIGKAQAVALLVAANQQVPAFEYTPRQVKQRIASYGASSKEQIQEMVRLQLGLSEVPEPDDAADALAVALCHLAEEHLNSLLREQK